MSNASVIVRALLEDEEDFDPREYMLNGPQGHDRRIKIAYSQTTPESVEDGDTSETGWYDEEGVDMDLDDWDIEDGVSVVDKAVEFLKKEGATDPSSSEADVGTWYSTGYNTIDYTTGTDEEKTYHLKNFSPEEEVEIYKQVTRRPNYGVPH